MDLDDGIISLRQPRDIAGSHYAVTQSGLVVTGPACQADEMCRNIKVLNNFEPPATPDEVHAAALQYVRKVSGSTAPSAANQAVFDEAVHEIAHLTRHLLDGLTTSAPKRDRAEEAAKARARNEKRFGASV
jgi:hypothetical protein